MKNLKKVSKVSKLAFLNALRLHKDSILLYKNKSYPSSYQLSIIAQEEIGKSYIMEDHIFQMRGRTEDVDSELEKMIIDAMLSHKVKQGSFSRQADDPWKYRGKKYPRIISDISSGALEEKKQNATYVGLTKEAGRVSPNGKVINPEQKIKPEDSFFMITRVNNFIIELIEGVRRGVYGVDSDDLDEILSIKIVEELEALWPEKSRDTVNKLKRIRKFEIE